VIGVVLVTGAVLALVRREPIGVAALLVGAAVWPFVDDPLAGPVLLTLAPGHGIHAGDTPAIVAVALAVVAGVRLRSFPAPARRPSGSCDDHSL
jgi:hypothetical protein